MMGECAKSSPLCGRNFEYFSEDPYLSSEMAASHIRGVQSQGVGTSLKHFAVNNQEHRRMSVDAVLDERTLRGIYLASFEGAMKQAKPWTVAARQLLDAFNPFGGAAEQDAGGMFEAIIRYLPLRNLVSFSGGKLTERQLDDWIAGLNRKLSAAES